MENGRQSCRLVAQVDADALQHQRRKHQHGDARQDAERAGAVGQALGPRDEPPPEEGDHGHEHEDLYQVDKEEPTGIVVEERDVQAGKETLRRRGPEW